MFGGLPMLPSAKSFQGSQSGLVLYLFIRIWLIYAVHAGAVGLVSRFGHFYRAVDPGLVQVNVCTESLKIVDVKIQIAPIGRQT
jgi:hypothetical protein